MNQSSNPARQPVPRTFPGGRLMTLDLPGRRELFLSAASLPGQPPEAFFASVDAALREGGYHVLSQEIFGEYDETASALERAMGAVAWPVTWVREAEPLSSLKTQLWAIAGVPVRPLHGDAGVVGTVFEDASARYCRLGGLMPDPRLGARDAQADAIFGQMLALLAKEGMDFSHVARTWFYNDGMLDWYGDFNRVRTAFFQEHGVFDGVVPASTGVGGRNPRGSALTGGLLAVKPKQQDVQAIIVPSPLQCPAPEYGSSFSRAVELASPGCKRLFVSGTASIAPEGESVHLGDVDAQVKLTMDVVEAILESRGYAWQDVSRAIGYFKLATDVPAFERFRAAAGLPPFPIVFVNNDICRDDLLFEIELDAVRVG